MFNKIFFVLLVLAVSGEFFMGSCPNAQVVQDFDVAKYTGVWWEIQRTKSVPYYATNRCVTADYELKDDGSISVKNQNLGTNGDYNV